MVSVNIKSELHLLIDSIEEEEVLLAVKALLERCAPAQEPALSPAHVSEIERRLDMLRKGEMKLYSEEEALADIEKDL